MGTPIIRSGNFRTATGTMRLMVGVFIGVVFGFFLGVSLPTLSLCKMNLPSSLFPSVDLTYIEDKYSNVQNRPFWDTWDSFKGNRKMSNGLPRPNDTKIWIPTNPKGAERLPPGIVNSESDYYARRLWGQVNEDLPIQPKYLVAFTVGYNQRNNIDSAVKKFSENFTIVLFHYDGWVNEWDQFEWSKRAIHVSVRKQTKWYLRLVREYGLEISQPALDPRSGFTWQMTKKKDGTITHMEVEEKNGWCADLRLPPCAAFVEIMAPVFSRDAWRCVWHMTQNDLVHGWGLDFALRNCVEPGHEKIGVVDAQWILHQSVPSLGNQGQAEDGKAPWEGVRERCYNEWTMFQERMTQAERDYFQTVGITPPNSSTNHFG